MKLIHMNDTIKKILTNLGLKPVNWHLGKKMGNNIWFHISYAKQFNLNSNTLDDMCSKLKFKPNIVRIDTKKDLVSLINSPDFDVSKEPFIKESALFSNNELLKINNEQENPQIYHHKWMFVDESYSGFDYQEQIQRSITWKSLLGVNKTVSSRIGRKKYWLNWLEEQGIEQ